jgi:hypothetical protein
MYFTWRGVSDDCTPVKGLGGSGNIKKANQITSAIMYATAGAKLAAGAILVPNSERNKTVSKMPSDEIENPNAMPKA